MSYNNCTNKVIFCYLTIPCSLIWEHLISQMDYVGWNTLTDNLREH